MGNQVRKLFIANAVNDAVRASIDLLEEGEVQAFAADGTGVPAAGESFIIATKTDGIINKSEIIEPEKVLVHAEKAFLTKLPVWTTVLTGTPTSDTGKIVELVFAIENYGANNSSSVPYYMHVAHTIVSGDTLTTITAGLETVGNAIAAKTGIPITFDGTTTGGTIVATSARTPFKLGKFAGEPVNSRLVVKIADTDLSEATTVTYTTVVNGIEVANMEWLLLGNTGDTYRGHGYPNNIDSNYVALPTHDYEVVELAFYSERLSAPGDKQRSMITIAYDKALTSGDVDTQIKDPITAALA